MSFGSIGFLLFMIAVFLLYWGIPQKYRWVLLLAANAVFYLCFDVRFILVLIYVIAVSFFTGRYLYERKNGNVSGFALFLIVLVVLMPLLVFKYLNFGIYTVQKALSIISVPMDIHTLNLIMPVGISFFTFEALAYVLDIYKGKIVPEKNILKYALFVSFFPNITSGPIERADSFIPQIDREKKFDYEMAVYGLRLMLLGMLKKFVCADIMVKYISNVFDHVIGYTGTVFIIATVMYTFQIYFDFSGYTDMARAIGLLLGFDLRENFKAPYFATSIKEFWGRWHISLSTWLRDYVYIPLGGNRKGKLRKNINLLITFFVSGLWHGASFTFIVWGLIHGLAQCIEGLFPYKRESGIKIRKLIRMAVTFCIVSFAWMFFRVSSLAECVFVIKNMFAGGTILGAFQAMGMTKFSIVKCGLGIVFVMLFDLFNIKRDLLKDMSKLNMVLRWGIYLAVAVVVIVVKVHEGTNASFIYFSF